MKTKEIYIGEEKVSNTLSMDILVRAYSQPALKEIWENYKNACHVTHGGGAPTEMQHKLAKLVKKGMRAKNIAEQEKVKPFQVYLAVRRVAVWEFMNK